MNVARSRSHSVRRTSRLAGIDVNPTVAPPVTLTRRPATRRTASPSAHRAAVYVATPSFDGAHWDETERAKDKPTIQHTFETLTSTSKRQTFARRGQRRQGHALQRSHRDLYDSPSRSVRLILNWPTGRDKSTRASTGPYSMITASHSVQGAVRWSALRGDGSRAPSLRRRLRAAGTSDVKSDDMKGRERAYRGD